MVGGAELYGSSVAVGFLHSCFLNHRIVAQRKLCAGLMPKLYAYSMLFMLVDR